MLQPNVVAGFDYGTGNIVIRKNSTVVSLYHEGFHAQLFFEWGKDRYVALGRLAREGYVYEEIVSESKVSLKVLIYQAL